MKNITIQDRPVKERKLQETVNISKKRKRGSNTRWWLSNRKHEDVFSIVSNLQSTQSQRLRKQQLYAMLYSNTDLFGANTGADFGMTRRSAFNDENKIKLNIVSSISDTICSKIGKNRPRVVLLTEGATDSVQHESQKLEQYISGCMYESGAHNEAKMALLDAIVEGTGIIKIFERDEEIRIERVFCQELRIDETEARYAKPRSIYQVKHISKEVLVDMFEDFEKEIEDSGILSVDSSTKSADEMVAVVEAWHLKSGKNAKDGCHVICIGEAVLFEEEYCEEDFPFVFIHWKKPMVGFWGLGVIDDVLGIQVEINKLLKFIQNAFHLLSAPKVFVDAKSKISTSYVDNEIGTIIPYVGTPPIIAAAQTVHPEIFAQIESLYRKAYEITGCSQLSANAQKPAGLNSGVALEQYHDIESERFASFAQSWENLFIDSAYKMIKIAERLYKDSGKDTAVKGQGAGFIKTIKWSEINIDESKYILKVSAASSLPESKAGRIQMLMNWHQMQLIDGDKFKELADVPDLKADGELASAPKNYIKQIVNKILVEGIATPPEETDDIQFALSYASMKYSQARLNEEPEDRIQMLREFIDDCISIIKNAQKQAAEEAAAQQPQQLPPQGQQ